MDVPAVRANACAGAWKALDKDKDGKLDIVELRYGHNPHIMIHMSSQVRQRVRVAPFRVVIGFILGCDAAKVSTEQLVVVLARATGCDEADVDATNPATAVTKAQFVFYLSNVRYADHDDEVHEAFGQ